MTGDAVLLGGPLGLGHEMMARCCADLLERSGWRTRNLDSMSLLGAKSGGAGRRLFNALIYPLQGFAAHKGAFCGSTEQTYCAFKRGLALSQLFKMPRACNLT